MTKNQTHCFTWSESIEESVSDEGQVVLDKADCTPPVKPCCQMPLPVWKGIPSARRRVIQAAWTGI